MVKRKLIQLSPSTIVASLPSKWISNNKLKKGDEVTLQEIENNIMISCNSNKSKNKVEVDLRSLNEDLTFAHADATYIAGYDDITFLIEGKEQVEIMEHVSKEVPGMIIFEQSKNRFRFKDITNGNNEDVDIIINRIFNMVISMLEDSIEAINEKDWEALRKMKSRDYVMNSYVSYCQRLINKFGYSSFSKSGLIMVYLKIVEMISDKICAIFKHCAKNKINITLEIKQLLIIYRMIQRIHSKFDSKKISEFNKERLKLKSSKINVDEIKELLFDLIEVEIQFNI